MCSAGCVQLTFTVTDSTDTAMCQHYVMSGFRDAKFSTSCSSVTAGFLIVPAVDAVHWSILMLQQNTRKDMWRCHRLLFTEHTSYFFSNKSPWWIKVWAARFSGKKLYSNTAFRVDKYGTIIYRIKALYHKVFSCIYIFMFNCFDSLHYSIISINFLLL